MDADLVELTLICSRTSSNETADDLPGPGRTLGKVYDFAGHHLEAFLNKTAEKMGHGPRVTVERIRRRRSEIALSASVETLRDYAVYHPIIASCRLSPASVKMKVKKIEKDIKRLLKYVESKVPSTQKQALDHILDLSVDYSDLRALLKSKGATQIISDSVQIYSKFRFSDFDDVLLNSSRKALISLADAEINMLLREWIIMTTDTRLNDQAIVRPLWNKIAPYLNNPETAFLVMRVLRRMDKTYCSSTLECVLASVRNAPNYFEWEACEAAFHHVILHIYIFSEEVQSSLGEWVLRHADKMPRVIDSDPFQWQSIKFYEMDSSSILCVHNVRSAFVRAVISTGGADEHNLSLDALRSTYTYPGLQPLLSALACPLERTVIDFVEDNSVFYCLTPTSAEFSFYNKIAGYIDCADGTLRVKALGYASYFLSLDICRCDMMIQALSTTRFSRTRGFSNVMKTMKKQCMPEEGFDCRSFFRHIDRNDGQIHLHDGITHHCSCDIMDEEEMTYYSNWTLDMKVEFGAAFSSAGLYPLLAGYGADGKRAYVAWIYFHAFDCAECHIRSDYPLHVLSTVTEGTKPDDVPIEVHCPHRRVLTICAWFEVVVLRYAPETYPKVLEIDEEGVDATGPFSWRSAQEHIARRCRYGAKVFSTWDEVNNVFGNRGNIDSDSEHDVFGLHSRDGEREAESSSQSEEAKFLACVAGADAELKSWASEMGSLACDGIRQPETDVDLPICDSNGATETNTAPELGEFERKLGLDSKTNELEYHSCGEENKDKSDSLQSDKVELSSCQGEETELDLETAKLDSLWCSKICQLTTDMESHDVQIPAHDGGTMATVLASQTDRCLPDGSGKHVFAPEVHRAVKLVDWFKFEMPDLHSTIFYAIIFSLGYMLKSFIS